jgi:biopolymer transport protein ExbD
VRALVVLALLAGACAPIDTKVGKARLADADGTEPARPGPTVEVPGPPAAPAQGPVRLAADREATYGQVREAMKAIEAQGGEPVLLVARRGEVEALPRPDTLKGPAIKLRAEVEGKACISPPDTDEATCVKGHFQKHIDRAFLRQIVRQAVREYGLKEVRITVDADLAWGDAVRAIDGARTCCGIPVAVSVEP